MMGAKRLESTFETGRNFKVVHQFLSISSIEVEEESFAGFTELTIIPLKTQLSEIRLNCGEALTIERVTVNDVETNFRLRRPQVEIGEGLEPKALSAAVEKAMEETDAELGGGELSIHLPKSIAETIREMRSFRVALDFNLERPKSGFRFVVPRGELGRDERREGTEEGEALEASVEEDGVHIYSYPSGSTGSRSSAWFPCVDAWSELSLWKIEISVPASWTAVASGELTQSVYSPHLQEKSFFYQLNVPTSPGNIGFAAGPFQIAVHPEMNELSFFCLPGLLSLLKHTTAQMDKVCEYLEELLSSRLPHPSYAQVFVDELGSECVSYAGLSLLPLSLLHHSRLIDPVIPARSTLADALAAQFFGSFLCPASAADVWLTKGLAKYIASLYRSKVFGLNEALWRLRSIQREVCDYECRWGGICLRPATASEAQCPKAPSDLYIAALEKKAELVIGLLERKLGHDIFLQILMKLLGLGVAAKRSKDKVGLWMHGLLVSTKSFLTAVSSLTGQELPTFAQLWLSGRGHPHFKVQIQFNRKRNIVELEIEQRPEVRGRMKYVGPMKVTVQELDGTFTHTIQIDDINSHHELSCHSKTRRQKKRRIPLWTTEEVEMDLGMSDPDSPVLWVKVDPDLALIRSLSLTQPDFQWLYQLKYERDVLAQLDALEALPRYPSAQARQTLIEVIDSANNFHRVRSRACRTLADVSKKLAVASGPPALLNVWRSQFASISSPDIPKMNNFSNFTQYFIQQAIPAGMARVKRGERLDESHPIVIKFLLDLLKYNDNSENKYDDDHYRAGLLVALSVAVGKPAYSPASSLSLPLFQRLNLEEQAVVEELALALNRDQLEPSHGSLVSQAALQGLYTLMKKGLIPPDPALFWAYAKPPRYSKLRLAALEILVDLAAFQKKRSLMDEMISQLTCLREPSLRYGLASLLASRPPFTRSEQDHRLNTPALRTKLSQLIAQSAYSDPRLSALLVHAYTAMYSMEAVGPSESSLQIASSVSTISTVSTKSGGQVESMMERSMVVEAIASASLSLSTSSSTSSAEPSFKRFHHAN